MLGGLILLVAAPGVALPDGRPVYFVRDVAPIFDQEGCSGGACHGKFGGGQGRLQLSLMTLAPVVDFPGLEPLVDLQNPEASLLLRKPTAQVPHGGGRRFKQGSDEYDTILSWIENGCPNPSKEALPVALSVQPERFVFGPDKKKGTITVTATFADGSSEVVTDRTRFIAQDEAIASVSPNGTVRGERWGMTAIMCRYVGLTKPVFVSMPRPADESDPAPPEYQPTNMLDTLVLKNLEWLNLNPAPLCDDYTYLRRVSLDLVGALPNPDDIRAFVADPDPKKREKKVDELLNDPRYVALRTLRLGDMLRINPRKLAGGPLAERAAMVFDTWLRDSVRENIPYDQFARELLTATGSTMLNGPANFYRVERRPEDRAETVGQSFLGVRLACARCHNHPFDRWTTDDYWDFAAFMVKVQERGGELYNEGVLYHNDEARLRNQAVTSTKRGQYAVPTLLGGPALPEKEFDGDYLTTLADWITAPDNRFFARATVNRIWSHLMGRGVVEPVDDLRETSVETVPILLHELSREFVASGYDTKALVRSIVTSKAYQFSAASDATNVLGGPYFAHYQPKAMLPQVLLDSINSACGTTDQFGPFPRGTTAVELPLMVRHDFLDRFGRSDREFLAVLDPHVEPTLTQTLHLINSSYINNKVAARGGTVEQLTGEIQNDAKLVEELYLRTLCRPPSEAEVKQVLDYLGTVSNRREAFEDLLWALITSREFLFIS